MGRYYVKRITAMIITLFFVITFTFFILHSIPGGPFTREKVLPEAIVKALETTYKLDQPLIYQYFDYLKSILHLDLGPSFQMIDYSVNDLLAEKFPVSAKIGLLTVIFSILTGIPMGIVSALKQNKWQDHVILFFTILGATIPNFIMGTLFIFFFGVKLKWVPTFGLHSPLAYIGPILVLGSFETAFIAKVVRSGLIEALKQDYIRTARAKGLSEYNAIVKHALKNSLIPVVSFMAPMIAVILTGSFVVERIFAIPGMGKLFVESVTNRDYTVVIGSTVLYAVILVFLILIVDMIYGFLDPRVKLK